MACLVEMYKNSASPQQQSQCISPRISFSNDFADSSHNPTCQHSQSENTPPRSSDFQFSVTNNYNMLCADELFFKGRLLPFKDHNTTLRDELLNDHHYDYDDDVNNKTPTKMASCRWKAFLGLTRSHFGSKKPAQNDASLNAAPPISFSFQPPNNTLLTKPPLEMQKCSEDSVAVSTDEEMKSSRDN